MGEDLLALLRFGPAADATAPAGDATAPASSGAAPAASAGPPPSDWDDDVAAIVASLNK